MKNNADAIVFFSRFIERELGIVYSEFNHFQLQNRLEDIVRMLAFRSIDELLMEAKTKMTPSLRQLILDVATNNETSFFRDEKLFQACRSKLIPDLFTSRQGRSVRIWSAACSTGQEPYSLLMMILEFLKTSVVETEFSILATDVSSRALARATSARYSQLEVQRGIPAQLLVKYFEKESENEWTIPARFRSSIHFEKMNLLDHFANIGPFDLIFCRNILLYQDVMNKSRIISKLASCLTPEAFLVLGAGESMIGLSDDFQMVKLDDAILYRRRGIAQGRAA